MENEQKYIPNMIQQIYEKSFFFLTKRGHKKRKEKKKSSNHNSVKAKFGNLSQNILIILKVIVYGMKDQVNLYFFFLSLSLFLSLPPFFHTDRDTFSLSKEVLERIDDSTLIFNFIVCL